MSLVVAMPLMVTLAPEIGPASVVAVMRIVADADACAWTGIEAAAKTRRAAILNLLRDIRIEAFLKSTFTHRAILLMRSLHLFEYVFYEMKMQDS